MIVPPTIIVGVGGAGGSIALRTKARLLEYAAGRPNPGAEKALVERYVKLFVVDTRREAETFEQQAEVFILAPQGAPRYVQASQDRFFRSWWPSHITSITPFIKGAGGQRAKGRLAYYLEGSRIGQAVQEAAEKLVNVRREDPDARADGSASPVFVLVVGSLSGGTGSGTILTLAQDIRHAVDPDVRLIGAIPLASIMDMAPADLGKDNIWANTSAALRELEWWLIPPTLQRVDIRPFFELGGRAIFPRADPRPTETPFDLVYLFTKLNRGGKRLGEDGANEGGQARSGKQGMGKQARASTSEYTSYIDLVADCLALDVYSPIADGNAVAASQWLQYVGHRVAPAGGPDPKPIVFASACVASLEYPVDAISAYLGGLAAADLVNHHFLTPEPLGTDASSWINGRGLLPDALRQELEVAAKDPVSRDDLFLAPAPELAEDLEAAGHPDEAVARARGKRDEFDNTWLPMAGRIATLNRGRLAAEHVAALREDISKRLLATPDGFERARTFAQDLRAEVARQRRGVNDDLNGSEGNRGRFAEREALIAEYPKALEALGDGWGLMGLNAKRRKKAFLDDWWEPWVAVNQETTAGNALVALYDEVLGHLGRIVDVLDEVHAFLAGQVLRWRDEIPAEFDSIDRRRPVLETRVLGERAFVDAAFVDDRKALGAPDSAAMTAMARGIVGDPGGIADLLAHLAAPERLAEPLRPEDEAEAVRAGLEPVLARAQERGAAVFRPAVDRYSIWDALKLELRERRAQKQPDEYMRALDPNDKLPIEELVIRYAENRVNHCVGQAQPFWRLNEVRVHDNHQTYPVLTDGVIEYPAPPWERLAVSLGGLRAATGLKVQIGESRQRVIASRRDFGAPLFMLHPDEQSRLLDFEQRWQMSQGHVYIDQRYEGVLPPDFDRRADDGALTFACALHFGLLRYKPGANGTTNRGLLERTENPAAKTPRWRRFSQGLAAGLAMMEEDPALARSLRDQVAAAWDKVPRAGRRAELEALSEWLAGELDAAGAGPRADALATLQEAVGTALAEGAAR